MTTGERAARAVPGAIAFGSLADFLIGASEKHGNMLHAAPLAGGLATAALVCVYSFVGEN